jgi:purine nucleosidase
VRAAGGRDLTIVALGPLTNLALAVERDAAAVRGVRRVVAMGGAVDVPGNVTPHAEFNVYVDPEALAHVLDAGVRFDLVPLEPRVRRSWSAPRCSRRRPRRRVHRRTGSCDSPTTRCASTRRTESAV